MPWMPSLAWKNSVPFTFVRYLGYEPPVTGLMSSTRNVPAAVPLLSHSSTRGAVVGREEQGPVHVRQVMRIRAARARVDVCDEEGAGGGAVALPQLSPWVPSLAWKNSVPFTFVRYSGYELAVPGLMSATRKVPAAVPLLSHSSSRGCRRWPGRTGSRSRSSGL